MKWSIGTNTYSAAPTIDPSSLATSLPSDHPPIPAVASSSRAPAQCPMSSSASGSGSGPMAAMAAARSSSSSSPAKCPIQHDSIDKMNPLNNIPANLSLTRQPGQQLDLPTDRTQSTIPRPKGDNPGGEAYGLGETWDYPSPQQFYNALVRKGWETPEESVEVMVDIHNFLNERAWQEVMKWEKKLPGGENAQLARFTGRPGDLSPKARFHLFAAKFFPNTFNTEPPFDRHDWIVTRPLQAPHNTPATPPSERVEATQRYVIDYYSAAPDEDGNPVFSLDVRPALDSFQSVSQRVQMAFEEWRSTEQE
ncbi:hypothetical protein IAU60_006076 [Kwoniella sp. DSM 27419]